MNHDIFDNEFLSQSMDHEGIDKIKVVGQIVPCDNRDIDDNVKLIKETQFLVCTIIRSFKIIHMIEL